MGAELLAAVGAGFTMLVGWLVIGSWVQPGWVAGAALSFAAGAGILSLQMLIYGLLRLPWSLWGIVTPWLVASYVRLRVRPKGPHLPRLNWVEWVALAALPVASIAWLPYERLMPLNTQNWDAWAIWLFKAKAFFIDGNLRGILSRAGEFTAQPSYPLLVPLYGTFLYSLAGGPVDQIGKAISPLFFFALLGCFFHMARRLGSRTGAFVFTAMLANLHMVNIVAFELAGYADTTLSVYLLLGAGFLCAWLQEQQPQDLILASLFSSLAAWTKNEGLFFFAAVIAVASFRLVRGNRPSSAWTWAAVLIWPLLCVALWIVMRWAYDVPGAQLFGVGLNWKNLAAGVASVVGQAAKPNVYNLTFWLFAAGLIAFRRSGLVLPDLVLWQLVGLLAVYAFGRNEIQWWIGTSLDRILAQVAPLALLSAAVVAGHWIERAEQQSAPAPPGSKRRRKR